MIDDYLRRQGQIAQFGDQIVGQRTADIMEAFHYGLNTYSLEAPALSGTGAASVSNAVLAISSGAGVGAARVATKRNLRYQPGFDGYAYFTAAFSAGGAGTYQRIGIFDDNNGFWLGQEGGNFYIARRYGGTDHKQGIDFNAAGAHFTAANINAFRINYGWLGVLPAIFEYYDAGPGVWKELGRLSTADAGVTVTTLQPNQQMVAEAGRTSGSGAVTIHTASWSAGRVEQDQPRLPSDREFSATNSKAGITTETNIITIKSATTFQGVNNHVVCALDFLSLATEGSKPVTFYVKRNASLGGSPSYTDRDATNSVMSYDTAGTTVTGGTLEYPFGLAKTDSKQLSSLYLLIYPGDTITVSATSSVSADVVAALRWRELF